MMAEFAFTTKITLCPKCRTRLFEIVRIPRFEPADVFHCINCHGLFLKNEQEMKQIGEVPVQLWPKP